MIVIGVDVHVIGVDVHKDSLTAAAVDQTGRLLAERTLAGGEDGLVAWAATLSAERMWAIEDCRHVTGGSSGSCSRRVSGWCGCRRS
jgi:hypothetical protein